MIVIRVLLKVKPEETKALSKFLFVEAAEVPTKFVGCKLFKLFADPADENSFLLYEEWESLDDFNVYKNSAYFAENGEQIFPKLAEKPNSTYYQVTLLQQTDNQPMG